MEPIEEILRKKNARKKSDRHYEYCNTNGHVRDICFKLHGQLDQFKQLWKQKEKVPSKLTTNVIDTPLDVVCDRRIGKNAKLTSSIAKIIQQEIAKYMKGKSVVDSNNINLTYLREFSSTILKYALNILDLLEPGIRIIDIKTSNHMCTDLNLIDLLSILTKFILDSFFLIPIMFYKT